ncbi:MAG TPA: helix-turn-helix domain-containing protein [Thermoanaerobaculia bacterium]|nr:helix-turn-helix domain-containing protein [Thermoanaerobaculia bacterium]
MPSPAVPGLRSVALTALRRRRGWNQEELAAKAGISSVLASRYETTRQPSRKRLDSFARLMGYDPEDLELLLLSLERSTAEPPSSGPLSPVDPTADEMRDLQRVAFRVGLATVDLTERTLNALVRGRRAQKSRRRAERLWERFKRLPAAERELLVERSVEHQTWAFAERLAHASAEAAAHKVKLALELAGLACRVAELAPGDPAWRTRLTAYTLAFLANSQRVANDLRGAAALFARARVLWEEGARADPGILAAWRLPDLEASLRRDETEFPAALELLDRARAVAPPEALGRILVKRASVLEAMGEAEQAVETLKEAIPLVDGRRDPRLPCVLRFNLLANLCHLNRFAEAEAGLPEVRQLAVSLRTEFDLLRVTWLAAKIGAGLGRGAEARASFEQVRRTLTGRQPISPAASAASSNGRATIPVCSSNLDREADRQRETAGPVSKRRPGNPPTATGPQCKSCRWDRSGNPRPPGSSAREGPR